VSEFVYKLPRCANLHANVQERESNLLGIKTVRRNISKKLSMKSRVRRSVELRRPCGSFLFSFVLLVFPSSSSSSYSSSSSFPARGSIGSFFSSSWKKLAESASRSRLACAPRSETPLNKSVRECRRVYQFTNRARSSTVKPTRNDP